MRPEDRHCSGEGTQEDHQVNRSGRKSLWPFCSFINAPLFSLNFSQQNIPSTSYSRLPSGDLSPLSQSPTSSVPELPPIDYENRMRNTSPIPAQMNGSEHGKSTQTFATLSASFWTSFTFRNTLLHTLPSHHRGCCSTSEEFFSEFC